MSLTTKGYLPDRAYASRHGWGYADLDNAEEHLDEQGRTVITVWYSDQDGGEMGYLEFYKGDYVPDMWCF